jgi:hypothetical protein
LRAAVGISQKGRFLIELREVGGHPAERDLNDSPNIAIVFAGSRTLLIGYRDILQFDHI